MLTRRTVLWAARETTYGTDPAMTAADGILVYDLDYTINGEKLERPVLRDSLSKLPHVIGMKDMQITFKTELKGNGLTGTQPNRPAEDVLYSACSFNTGLLSGTGLLYSLVSDESNVGSVALRIFFDDANVHKMNGTRGSVKFNMQAGQYGYAEWTLSGLYTSVASATTPAITVGTSVPPIVYNSSFQIGGFSPVSSAAEIDMGVNVSRRASLNASYGVHSFRLTDRQPMLNFDADAVAESSNPFLADTEGNIVDTFGITIGSSAGNTITIRGFFEYDNFPKYGDQEGVRKYDCTAALISSSAAGNDEINILYT